MIVTGGATDVSIDIRAMTSAGAALEGKVAADFVLWYRRDGAKVAISLSDLALLTTAHTDGGIKEIDDGWYRLDLPDAAVAAGVNRVAIGGTVDGGVVLSAPVTIDPVKPLLDLMAPIIIGSVTGARTGTEVFVYGGVTATVTPDSDGNRSIVFS
jgi:hypothetical protein